MNTSTYIKAEVIYLDVDGVLLANDKYPAKHVTDFLRFLVNNFDVYWLTTHVHNGDTAWVHKFLSGLLDDESIQLIKHIKATKTDWKEAKTEAIDITQPFLWLDDDLYPEERREFELLGCLENWIEIDLSKNEDQLKHLINNFPKATVPLMDEVKTYDR